MAASTINGISVPEGFKVETEREPYGGQVIVVSGFGEHVVIDGAKPDIRSEIMGAIDHIRQKLADDFLRTGKASGASAVISSAGTFEVNPAWAAATWSGTLPSSGGITMAPVAISPATLMVAHARAEVSEYLTSLQIERNGIVVVMQDGEDYQTALCPWPVLSAHLGAANPLAELIDRLEDQRRNGEW